MIDILNRHAWAVLYHSETADSIAAAVLEAYKDGADLRRANLRRADLSDADLRRANLSGADLGGANLYGANLYGAHLVDADLSDADLRRANLSGADLGGANLRRANLSGADLGGANLGGAGGLLPNGITPLQILGTKHPLIVRTPGFITIGCEHHEIAWWEQHYRAVGRKENYTAQQINEYRNYIALAKYWMKTYGVSDPVKAEATA